MEYFVTAWCGIPAKFLSKEAVLTAKESGLDVIVGEYDRDGTLAALDLCAECGMKLSVTDSRIWTCLREPEKIDELIPAVCADYKDHPALHSYHVTDEPGCAAFPTLAKIAAKFRECDPDHLAYINLFPNYANEEQLGCPTYEEHIRRYLGEVKPELVSYDHYHFLTTNPVPSNVQITDEREAGIYQAAQNRTARAGFFDNFEVIRRESLRCGTPYMLIVLLTEHGPYRYLTKEEIAWEVYQSFAYGVSAMSYFTYWTPTYDEIWHWKNGMITADGQRTAHYANVKELNAETRLLGQRIAGTKSAAVFHVGEEAENVSFFPEDGYGRVKAVTGGRFTLGFYENGEFLVTNKNFAAPAAVTIIPTANGQLEKFDKLTGEWAPVGCVCPIEAGNGVLMRVK